MVQILEDTTLEDRSKTPGPGTYSISNTSFSRGIKFRSGRIRVKYNNSPGPGTYVIPSTLSQNSYSIQGKNIRKTLELSPGPGRYEIPNTIEKRSFSLGKTKRAFKKKKGKSKVRKVD